MLNFGSEYLGATGHLPPGIAKKILVENYPAFADDEQIHANHGKFFKMVGERYKLVEVFIERGFPLANKSNGSADGEVTACGWLVRATDRQMVILGKNGVQLLSTGDKSFLINQKGSC